MMMFEKFDKYFIVLVALFLVSCEKVIDLDLNAADPRYIIEGTISDQPGNQRVSISQTKNFDEDNNFTLLTNANVTVSDDLGNVFVFEPNEAGIYTHESMEGVSGRVYHLNVDIEGNVFTASSKMPDRVEVDSLYVQKIRNFGQVFYMTTFVYQDPGEVDNYYRHVMYINDYKVNSIYISRDTNNNGLEVTRALPFFDEVYAIEEGDVITVENYCIDKAVYEYFASLNQTIGQNVASPANPVSNISGNALGYFSAHTMQTTSVIVEDQD